MQHTFTCVLAHEARVFTVSTPPAARVGELKAAVKGTLSLGCPADLLKLFRVDGRLEEIPVAAGDQVAFLFNNQRVMADALSPAVLPTQLLLASHTLERYFPPASSEATANSVEILVEAPTHWAASDADAFLAKLDATLTKSVDVRMEWMHETLGRMESCVAYLRGDVKFEEETMNNMETVLARVEAHVTRLEATPAPAESG